MTERGLPFRYRAEVLEVVDGDTLRLRVDLGFRVHVVIDGRVRGVNSPEMDSAAGKDARAWAINYFAATNEVLIESYRDRRSFARWVVDVYDMAGESFADALLEAGHAARMSR